MIRPNFYKHQEQKYLREGKFTLDTIEGKEFSGYDMGEKWNGYECPYFETSEAINILGASSANGYSWNFDIRSGAFEVIHVDDKPDWPPLRFPAVELRMGEKTLVVYPIGAWVWNWKRVIR